MKKSAKAIKIIKANQILIEDKSGRPRILLDGIDGDAGVSITLLSKNNGEIRLSIDDENHGIISIRHPNGMTGACVAVKPGGQSGIELRDNKGLPSIIMESKTSHQKANIAIITAKEKGRV
jgi:hypothetical protein